MSLSIQIVTPLEIAFESEQVDKIFGPGFYGEFGLLQNHARFVTLNKPGIITVHVGADKTKLLVGKGFAEASENHASYLVELCENVDNIDKDSAKKDLEEAKAAIEGLSPLDSGYENIMDRIDLANARLGA
jgi:F-type H+-transporting ATPase subunit epsilon